MFFGAPFAIKLRDLQNFLSCNRYNAKASFLQFFVIQFSFKLLFFRKVFLISPISFHLNFHLIWLGSAQEFLSGDLWKFSLIEQYYLKVLWWQYSFVTKCYLYPKVDFNFQFHVLGIFRRFIVVSWFPNWIVLHNELIINFMTIDIWYPYHLIYVCKSNE